MSESVTGATAMLGLALLVVPAGCAVEVPIGRDDSRDADPAGDLAALPPARLCEAAGTSTVIGGGPHRRLDGFYAFANVRGGECRAAVELVLSPEPVLTMPHHPATVVIVAWTPADLLAASEDLTGTLAATISDRNGAVVVDGKLELLEAGPVDSAAAQLRAVATFDTAGWQLTASVEAPYCLIDECPCCQIPP